mgnify:CR=1 FL=1
MINIFTTPEGKKYAFNIPSNAKVDSKGFYIINETIKRANKHLNFNYLAHDLTYRGLRADNTKEPWCLDDTPLCKDAIRSLAKLPKENETRFTTGEKIVFYTGFNDDILATARIKTISSKDIYVHNDC